MIYEYKVLYNSSNVVEGYEYNIITGYDTNSDPILATFKLFADGVTNDREVLQSLLNEIHNQGGGTLILPAGKEMFLDGIPADPGQSQSSYPLTINSNIKITSTVKATLIFGQYIETRMISNPITYGPTTFYPVNNITLDNLVIKSIDPDPANAMFALRSSQTESCKNIKVLNCDFIGGTQTNRAISLEKVDGVFVENCTFLDMAVGIRIVNTVDEDDPSFDGNNNNIRVSNCKFKGGVSVVHGVNVSGATNFCIEKCTFLDGNLGVEISKNNKDIYIKDNVFEPSLINNPIRVSGSNLNSEYTDGLWITGNDIKIQRALQPYIENPALGIQRYPDGRLIWTNVYPATFPKPIGNSAINITCAPEEDSNGDIISGTHHQNVVVANNIATGPDYGFYDGGSGDLFSLKDIIRLKCYGNTSRNSGDLGFAIERCHFGVVNNNTADRNNSCGISVFDSTHINVTGNVCSDNELSRDGAYLGNPYGGIRVERSSVGVLVEGNYCYANSGVRRSYVNSLATAPVDPDTFYYNQTGSPTQQYGVVVKNVWNDIPHNIKIGNNHTSGMLWGNDYTNVKASQVLNTYTGSDAPTEGDYPLGTRLRNNLNVSSTASTSEWQVVNHIRMKSIATSLTGSDVIKTVTLNSQNSDAHKLIENNDFSTILAGDIIGIKTDHYAIHWASVVKVTITVDPTIGDIGEIQFTPVLPEDTSYTVTNLVIGTDPDVEVVDDKDIVCLRWEAL